MLREKLTQIESGMSVVDWHGNEIGEVTMVFYSDEDPDNPAPDTVSGETPSGSGTAKWIDEFVSALSLDKPIPEPLQKRLHREGFIRVHENYLLHDRYFFITLSQIANVVDDTVTLNVGRDSLMSFR